MAWAVGWSRVLTPQNIRKLSAKSKSVPSTSRQSASIETETARILAGKSRSPKEVLVEAAKQTKETGSSTCCVLMLDNVKDVMSAANIGDSGFLLLRSTDTSHKIVLKSQEQCHGFNFPFQVFSRLVKKLRSAPTAMTPTRLKSTRSMLSPTTSLSSAPMGM